MLTKYTWFLFLFQLTKKAAMTTEYNFEQTYLSINDKKRRFQN